MVVEEKWGLEEEVCMDVDMTEEDEQAFLSEIALTRGAVQFLSSDAPSLLPPPSSSLPSSSSNTVATVPQHVSEPPLHSSTSTFFFFFTVTA